MNTAIIYSPTACGKSYYKDLFAKSLNCKKIIDGWQPGEKIIQGALHLTNTPLDTIPDNVQQLSFVEACKLAGIVPKII